MHTSYVPSLGILLLGASVLAGGAWGQSPSAQNAQSTQTSAPASTTTADKPKDGQSTNPPKKVYTNDDLKGMSGDDVSVVGNANALKKTSANGATKNTQKDEAYWHNRAQNLRNQIAETDRQIAQMRVAIPQNSTSPDGSSTTGSNPIYFGGQGVRLRNLEARKVTLQKQMEDLEEEARKAGVPPGWLR